MQRERLQGKTSHPKAQRRKDQTFGGPEGLNFAPLRFA